MEAVSKILNIKQLAQYLNCSESMIRKLIYNNDIPYFRIGVAYHFNLDIINKWIISKHNEIDIGGYKNEFITSSSKI